MTFDTNTPTLILADRYGADCQVLWRAAVKLNWNVERPIRYSLQQAPLGPVGIFGPLTFCDIMAQRLMLGLLDPPDFWLAQLDPKYLKRKVEATTLGELASLNERTFIKPANDKVFQCGIYQRGRDVATRYIEKTSPVLVSEVVDFVFEIRFYVMDRQILTSSSYKELDLPEGLTRIELLDQAATWVTELLQEPNLDLPSAVVIDVGYISEKGWAVVEANQIYASGVYEDAIAENLLPALVRAGGGAESVSPADLKYLRSLG